MAKTARNQHLPVVAKFGGSSIKALGFKGLLEALENAFPRRKIICALSATQGITDHLIQEFNDVAAQAGYSSPHSARERFGPEYDLKVTMGEIESIWQASLAAKSQGKRATALCGSQARITTSPDHGSARIWSVDPIGISRLLPDNDIIFVAGFQGVTAQGATTSLGRGASDLTAIAVAAGLGIETAYIFTDVTGVATADPRRLINWSTIPEMSYAEALELSTFGNKVIQHRAVALAQKYNINIDIRSALEPRKAGTLIRPGFSLKRPSAKRKQIGIALREELTLFRVEIKNAPGSTRSLFHALAAADITPHHISHGLAEDRTMAEFVVDKGFAEVVTSTLAPLREDSVILSVSQDEAVAELSLVSASYSETTGKVLEISQLLARNGVRIASLITAGIRITILLDRGQIELALSLIHKLYFEPAYDDSI